MSRTNEQLAKHYLILAFEALIDWQDEPHTVEEILVLQVPIAKAIDLLKTLGIDPDTANAGDY